VGFVAECRLPSVHGMQEVRGSSPLSSIHKSRGSRQLEPSSSEIVSSFFRNSSPTVIELSDWDACDGWYDLEEDATYYLGLDLSDRNDLTALIGIRGDFERGFNVACRFWLPRENSAKLERQHQVPYRTWADQVHIILTDCNSIDYEFVKAQIVEIASRSTSSALR
jgi:phage terminase large subunit-like protein